MNRPYLSFSKLCKILSVILVLYSFSWYLVGQYVRNNAVNTIRGYINVESVSHQDINLTGFPFEFSLNIKKLKIVLNNDNKRTTVFTKEIWFTSDLLLKNFELDLRRKLYVTSDDNRINYVIKIHQDANIDFGLTKSMLRKISFQPNLKMFMRYLSYFDSGYDVMDRNTNRIVAVSRYNKIFIDKDYSKEKRESVYTIDADLHSEVGGEENFDEVGDNHLGLGVIYKVTHMPSNKNMMSFILDIGKMHLNSDSYSVKAKGTLSNNLVTNSAFGKVDANIKSLNNFLKTCSIFMDKSKVDNLKKIITKMSSRNQKSGTIGDAFFSVTGDEKGIKYGNIGGVHKLLSMMQSKYTDN